MEKIKEFAEKNEGTIVALAFLVGYVIVQLLL